MVFTISLLIDVVISLLCIAGAVALCIYGGGMGVAIVIIILSLKEFWFPSPEKLGDKIFHKSRNMHPNRLKRKISIDNLKWQLKFSDNAQMRQGQIASVVLWIVALIYGIYCLQFGWTNQIGNLVIGRIKFGNHPNILHVMWMDVLLGACWYGISMIPSSVEYSKRKQKKIQKNLYNWKPWNYCGINRYPANQYLFCWNDYDEFRECLYKGSYYRGGYRPLERYNWNEKEFVDTYLREYDDKIALDIIQLIRIPRMQKKHIKQLNEYFETFIRSYFTENEWRTPITLTFILCVDEKTETYRKLIDTQIQQVQDRFIQPVGVVFKDHEIQMTTFWRCKDFEAGMLEEWLTMFLYQM